MSVRSRFLLLLAVAALGAVVASVERGTPSAPSESGRGATAAPPSLTDSLPQRARMGGSADAFPALSWAPPPPPPAPPPPQARPEPPPNPYRFAGTLTEGRKVRVFLSSSDRVYEAVPGQMLDDAYRTKSASRQGVVLLHVPLNVEQRVENPAVP